MTEKEQRHLQQRFSTSGPRPTDGPRSCFKWVAHSENFTLVLRGSLPPWHELASNGFFPYGVAKKHNTLSSVNIALQFNVFQFFVCFVHLN